MYQYMFGKVTEISSTYITLEVNNIGYLIYTPNPYAFSENEEVKIYIYQQIREDENTLYGFKSVEEKEFFLKLIGVKGLGCKMALPILATGSINGIVDAIDRENILYLRKFPKIGDKLAKQIILDLKGKVYADKSLPVSGGYEELVEVLKGLGYKEKEFSKVLTKVDSSMSIEDQVKEALKLLLK
ncbi:MAG: Holliday junction branch migration protein RuvA [Bacilli bacterium]|nr:Holliday junction branch migration protein RuvA [Bacilli bacterium]